jgi:hypothetical protein
VDSRGCGAILSSVKHISPASGDLMSTPEFVVLAILVVVMPLWWWLDPSRRRAVAFNAELVAREPLSDNDMLSRYFALDDVSPDIPGEVRRVFAEHTGYVAEKLLPDDDLNAFWADIDQSDLIKELESFFGITFKKADVERTPCTIRAVSMLVANNAGRVRRPT